MHTDKGRCIQTRRRGSVNSYNGIPHVVAHLLVSAQSTGFMHSRPTASVDWLIIFVFFNRTKGR